MTNQIFYWKPITSPADLPKEGKVYIIKRKESGRQFCEFNPDNNEEVEYWMKNVSHWLCPLTVDNIPEWVEEKANEIFPQIKKGDCINEKEWMEEDYEQGLKRKGFKACASLLVPLINQGKGETESKGEGAHGFWQLCPKCHGVGMLSRPPHLPADILEWSSTQTSFVCDVCNGMKVLCTPNSEPEAHECDATESESELPEADYKKQILELKSILSVKQRELEEVRKENERLKSHVKSYNP